MWDCLCSPTGALSEPRRALSEPRRALSRKWSVSETVSETCFGNRFGFRFVVSEIVSGFGFLFRKSFRSGASPTVPLRPSIPGSRRIDPTLCHLGNPELASQRLRSGSRSPESGGYGRWGRRTQGSLAPKTLLGWWTSAGAQLGTTYQPWVP